MYMSYHPAKRSAFQQNVCTHLEPDSQTLNCASAYDLHVYRVFV